MIYILAFHVFIPQHILWYIYTMIPYLFPGPVSFVFSIMTSWPENDFCVTFSREGNQRRPVDNLHKGTVMWRFGVSLLLTWTRFQTNNLFAIDISRRNTHMTTMRGMIATKRGRFSYACFSFIQVGHASSPPSRYIEGRSHTLCGVPWIAMGGREDIICISHFSGNFSKSITNPLKITVSNISVDAC